MNRTELELKLFASQCSTSVASHSKRPRSTTKCERRLFNKDDGAVGKKYPRIWEVIADQDRHTLDTIFRPKERLINRFNSMVFFLELTVPADLRCYWKNAYTVTHSS